MPDIALLDAVAKALNVMYQADGDESTLVDLTFLLADALTDEPRARATFLRRASMWAAGRGDA